MTFKDYSDIIDDHNVNAASIAASSLRVGVHAPAPLISSFLNKNNAAALREVSGYEITAPAI